MTERGKMLKSAMDGGEGDWPEMPETRPPYIVLRADPEDVVYVVAADLVCMTRNAAEAVGAVLSGQSTPQVNFSSTGTPAGGQPGTGMPGAGGEGLVWVLVGVGAAVTVAVVGIIVAVKHLR
jgi:hypothetical protein